jgi:hypothetical protein
MVWQIYVCHTFNVRRFRSVQEFNGEESAQDSDSDQLGIDGIWSFICPPLVIVVIV